jgi:ribosome maturation factor RimP
MLAESGLAPTFFAWDFMSGIDRQVIGRIIERAVSNEGLELVHWEVVGPPTRFILRVYIDKPGGISHSDCEAVSHRLGLLLDVEDPIPHSYILEVSSPGIERGLYKPADYERFAGNRIKLKTSEPICGQRSFRGRLIGLVEGMVRLEVDRVGQIEIPYEKIIKANLEYNFKF